MEKRIILALVLSVMLLSPLASAADVKGGEDVNPDESEVPFTINSRDSPSVDSELWSLTITMDDDEFQNNTTFEIMTQICLNDGVCDPPVIMDAEVNGAQHTISVTPPSDHTYVNWRVKAIYEDGNTTNFPTGDWYKTWSSCWNNDGTFGGVDSDGDGCIDDENTPGFGMLISVSAIGLAAISFRKE
tara:strand:+ start:1325 stop:1885 length:561 start_codon:yes stop_codon:yes gene_type:complete